VKIRLALEAAEAGLPFPQAAEGVEVEEEVVAQALLERFIRIDVLCRRRGCAAVGLRPLQRASVREHFKTNTTTLSADRSVRVNT
jgi:hypothetical protein